MVKRYLVAAAVALSLPLAGCAGFGSIPTSPGQVAEGTVLDERAAIAVELAYKASRTALEIAVDAGLLRGERAAQAAALDNRAYSAVQAARAAYRGANAASYYQAVDEARAAIAAALAAVKGA